MRACILVFVVWAGLASGCVSTPAVRNAAQVEASDCRTYLEALDRQTSAYGVTDAQAARVDGYPFLRANRFLASFPPGTLGADAFGEWLDRLQALDLDARRIEIANLPQGARDDLAARFGIEGQDPRALAQRAQVCGPILRQALVDSPDLRADLAIRVTVPDDYRGWQRVVGLYPLTQIPFAAGVHAWQSETERVFRAPFDTVPQQGELVRYLPPAAVKASSGTAAGIERWRSRGLGIPEFAPAELHGLLLAHAPVLVVDTATADDRIGTIGLDAARRSRVAVDSPLVYVYTSYARWRGEILLQLNYVFWFPSRPSDGAFDLLAGHLDGITWRVTLAPDGRVLVADTIHNCGCYHLFFPTPALQPVAYGAAAEERPFVPQRLPVLNPGERFTLHIAARTHYLQRVTATAGETVAGRAYDVQRYDVLRSLDTGGGVQASLFGPDGVVPGTDRGERFLFWPMGVPDPGAMRQRGRHATAFVGRRHFDDPWLLERSFMPADR